MVYFMSELQTNTFLNDGLDDMIIVTGLPRSGTTILGKLIGSFRAVEYAFEPPLVTYLDAQCRHDLLDSKTASELLKVYLYYDYFAEFVHGRGYNFRPSDASNVLKMQTVPEILKKWNRVESMADAVTVASEYTFSFKFPGTYHIISALYEPLPSVHIVDIGRNLDRVLASMFKKQWFFDHNLGPDATGLWPFHDCDGEYLVPYLVGDADTDNWQTMTPETRTAYICNRFAESRLAFTQQYGDRENYHQIRYERLIDDPATVTDELIMALGVARGSKTQSIVDEIEPTTAPCDVEAILADCDSEVRERFLELRQEFEY